MVWALATPERFTIMVLPAKVGLPEMLPVPLSMLADPLTTGLLNETTMV